MSLESKIETLTASIDRLCALMDTFTKQTDELVNAPVQVEPTAGSQNIVDVVKDVVSESVKTIEQLPETTKANDIDSSVDALVARCMSLVKGDRKFSAKIKTLLDSYGAKTIKDLTDNERVEFAVKLGEFA